MSEYSGSISYCPIQDLKKIMLLPSADMLSAELLEAQRQDRISHYILRLAFCESIDQSNWFIQLELELFKLRCAVEGPAYVSSFLKSNGIQLEKVEQSEQLQLEDDLISGSGMVLSKDKDFADIDFYKVRTAPSQPVRNGI